METRLRDGLGWKYTRTIVVLVLVFCVGTAFMIWQATLSHNRLAQSAVLHEAAHHSQLLSEFRALYTSEVVAPAVAHGLEISHDYKSGDAAIPLPATLSIMLGERITSTSNGGGVRLYSDHPFPWRDGGGAHDAFETDALRALRQNPDEPFYRFEKSDGLDVIRYATADVMRQNCVSCHNTHPDSPKKDWKVGDVRGSLEVILPMDAAIAQANRELQGTLVLVVGAGLFGLLGIFIVVRKFRGISADLVEEVEWRTRDLRHSQAKLRESEVQAKKLALVASRTSNAVIIADAQGQIEWVNDSLYRISELTDEQVIGNSLASVLETNANSDVDTLAIQEHLDQGEAFSLEIQKTAPSSRKYWVAVEVQSVRDDSENLINIIAIEQNITEQKNAAERITRLVEAAPNGMVMMRHDGVITHVNSKTEEMFGYARNEMVGQPVELLVPERYRDGHPILRNRFLESPTARSMGSGVDLTGQRKDGSEFPVELGLNPIETDEGMFVLAAIIDITERKQHELEQKEHAELVAANNTALQQYADEAKAANRAKSEFLASMSHELRTPLNAVIGFSEGLLERVDRHPLNDHQKDRLTKIHKSGEHLLSLINNVLDIAKVESGRVEVNPTEFEIRELTYEISALAEGLLKDNPLVRFDVDVQDDIHLVNTDRDKAKQILINLVGNAVKFTERGSIKLRIAQQRDHLCLSVEDTGVGIPNDQLHKVFDKFYQVEQAQHRSIKGTGLGLSLCKSFSELLGGTLTVRSCHGQGSAFTLSLPRSFDERQQETRFMLADEIRSQCKVENGQLLKVLCIEDDPHSMQLLVDTFHHENITVLPAFDSEEGLRLAKSELPDAITLDIMLPGMDGWKVLHLLKEDPATSEIPVIITSAVDDQKLALNLGADGHIAKPITQRQLVATINRISSEQSHDVRHVAVIDDNEETLTILSEIIESEGYTVTKFSSGKKFLDNLDTTHPDAVILDLMMPELDGFEVLDRMRAQPEYKNIPVIVMTAKMLTSSDLDDLNDKIRSVIEKNGLSRDQALGQLITQLVEMNTVEV